MADNYVEIRVKATDTAKPELDSLRADLDELGSKVDTAKIDVNDTDAKAKLLDINARLAAIGHKLENPRISIAGAAKAEADLARLDDRFAKLKESADKAKDHAVESMDGMREHASRLSELMSRLGTREGLLGKMLFGSGGAEGLKSDTESAVGGILGLLKKLPGGGAGEGEEGGGSAAGILGNLSGLAAGGGAIAVGLGAILVELDGLISGFAAAGAGIGAFALLAYPSISKVTGALKDTHAQLMKLSPDERQAVYGIRSLEHEWDRMSTAFQPAAFKVFNEALKVANELLPDVKPFADTAATALGGLLGQVGKFASSQGFKDWLAQFRKLEGPSIKAIGDGIGHVVTAFGKLITVMSAKDVVNSINIAFSILSGTINALTFIIRRIMLRWDQWQQLFRQVGHTTTEVGHDIEAVFDRIAADIARWAADVGRDTVRVVDWFRALPGRIMSALASLPGRLLSFGEHIIGMLADGIRNAAGGALSDAMHFVGGLISDFIPHSPAKRGPLSGSGDPRLGGRKIGTLLAQGLLDSTGAVDEAADRVTGGMRFGGRGGGAGGLQVVLEFHPPAGAAVLGSEFWTAFANGVRVRGGSPQIVTRKVAFR